MPWTEIYRPKKLSEIKGQEEAIDKVRIFLKKFGEGKKAIIFYGPTGTGKTTLAYVVAHETDSEIFELNASDLRNREKLNAVLKPAIEQKSLIKEKKIILVDEVDGLSKDDYGGMPELSELIEETPWPIILTANDIWDKNFSELRKKCEIVQFKEIDYKTIKDMLSLILKKENKSLDVNILTGISIKAKGDLRAAINDLQIASEMDDPFKILENDRNKEVDIFNALRLIFKEKPSDNTLRIFDSVNMPIDQIMLWIEENIPAEYKGAELQKAYDALSIADVFKGRIHRQQYWRFLVYENILLSYGIAASKEGIKRGFTNYKKPERILKIWLNNQRIAKKVSIAKKYAEYAHIGEKRALSEFTFLKYILKNENARKELKLDKEEEEYLEKIYAAEKFI
ncbi:MAG TPA: replication factor C large subunit [Candidatus Omnitrophota bacterium]|nr:replication factor C large subunit [Candidatus Omnitrophota bacterium]